MFGNRLLIIGIYYLIINIIAFAMYGIDKLMAVKHAYRVPEKTLILMAGLGGGLGALLGMLCFRHKIRKVKFVILVPVFLLIHIAAIVMYFKIVF